MTVFFFFFFQKNMWYHALQKVIRYNKYVLTATNT